MDPAMRSSWLVGIRCPGVFVWSSSGLGFALPRVLPVCKTVSPWPSWKAGQAKPLPSRTRQTACGTPNKEAIEALWNGLIAQNEARVRTGDEIMLLVENSRMIAQTSCCKQGAATRTQTLKPTENPYNTKANVGQLRKRQT